MRLKISYKLNISGTVKLTLKRHAAGRTVKGRCVAPTKKNRKRARCTRLVTLAASITLPGKAGANAFTLTGTIGRRRLGPGTYQLDGQADRHRPDRGASESDVHDRRLISPGRTARGPVSLGGQSSRSRPPNQRPDARPRSAPRGSS